MWYNTFMNKTVKSLTENEIVINKSRFITFLMNVNSIDEIKEKLAVYNKKYYDANHIVYAYIIKDMEKSSDDKEPTGTAGKPTLNVIQNEGLVNILAITVRYFGGIKLGSGGLVRAYTNAVKECVDKADFLYENTVVSINFTLTYAESAKFDQKKIPFISINKIFNEFVEYNIKVLKKDESSIDNELLMMSIHQTITKKEETLFI